MYEVLKAYAFEFSELQSQLVTFPLLIVALDENSQAAGRVNLMSANRNWGSGSTNGSKSSSG